MSKPLFGTRYTAPKFGRRVYKWVVPVYEIIIIKH